MEVQGRLQRQSVETIPKGSRLETYQSKRTWQNNCHEIVQESQDVKIHTQPISPA